MMNKLRSISALLLVLMTFFSACTTDDPMPDYDIPGTYDFIHVSYSGQTQRLNMLGEMKGYMAESRNGEIDANRLKAMFANDAASAQFAGTYEASKQLKNKTLESEQSKFEALMDELANASQSIVTGEAGVSGLIESMDRSKTYLVGEDGLDHAQVIEKGLMGACLYYQATAVYFGSDKMNVDNTEVSEGKGTAMEHHWDEAFGYFGVPIDFPTNTDGLLFWGSYSNKRNAVLGNSQRMMEAFIQGRAAISNHDLTTRDEMISTIRSEWELISVGSALHYLNEGIDHFDDMAIRSHGLSEAIGFIYSLKFNPEKTMDNSAIDALLTLVGGAASFDEMNLYLITQANLQQAKDELAAAFSLEEKKDLF